MRCVTVKRIGAYTAMTVIAPGIPELTRPGHFVAVQVGGPTSSMLLRRAFAIYDVQARGVYGGTVQFVFAVHGKGTAWLAERRAAATGSTSSARSASRSGCRRTRSTRRSSAAATAARRCCRWRGCCASAAAGSTFVLGAGSVDRLFGQLDAKRIADTIAVTTDDGSLGRARPGQRRAAVGAGDAPTATSSTPAARWRCCAPSPTSPTERGHRRRQVAVEESMACGIGVCMTCVLPVVGDDGLTRMVRSCVEGPVFLGDRVRWDDVGTVPADTVGAITAPGAHR